MQATAATVGTASFTVVLVAAFIRAAVFVREAASTRKVAFTTKAAFNIVKMRIILMNEMLLAP